MNDKTPRVLMYSNKNVASKILARCLWWEFEHIVQQVDNVKVLAPGRLNRFDTRYRIAAKAAQYGPIALNPGVEPVTIDCEYELFFAVCAFAKDLLYVNQVKNWKAKCKTSVCWIDEMFLSELSNLKYVPHVIAQFDHVIVSCQQAVGAIQPHISGECRFVLPGIDALLFSPDPTMPRSIDVLSIGRRSETMHAQLVEAAERDEIFYVHDSICSYGCKYGLTTSEPRAHRRLLANLAKRSNYFLVNTGKFDEAHATGGEDIIGARYFEGAAAGAILVGRRPTHPEFDNVFFWPDAVIDEMSAPSIMEIMKGLNQHHGRTGQIRYNNVVNSLLHHDWAYRWEHVLQLAGLDPTPEFYERNRALEARAVVMKEMVM